MVPSQEQARLVAPLRPPVADHAHTVESLTVDRIPCVQQIVEHGVETLFRRSPRLHQVVIEPDLVDRLDRHVGVGIGGEEEELRVRDDRSSAFEEIDASHLRHAMIRQDQRNRDVASAELLERSQGLGPRYRTDDPVPLRVTPSKVTGDRLRNGHIVVDGQNDWSRHGILLVGRPHNRSRARNYSSAENQNFE